MARSETGAALHGQVKSIGVKKTSRFDAAAVGTGCAFILMLSVWRSTRHEGLFVFGLPHIDGAHALMFLISDTFRLP